MANKIRQFGKFRLDAEKKILWFADQTVNLPLKEIELLCFMTEHSGDVLSKNQLMEGIWTNSFVEESNLSQHIYRLRKMFREFGETKELIQTLPRRGYRFAGEITCPNGNGYSHPENPVRQKRKLNGKPATTAPDIRKKVSGTNHRLNFPKTFVITSLILLTALGLYLGGRNYKPLPAENPVGSIAVLPLKAISDGSDRALGLGFTDALITRLNNIEGLEVLSVNAVSQFPDEKHNPSEIGRKLGVDAVIDGTIQRANSQIRVTLRLIRTTDSRQIWSDSFDDYEKNVFQLQDAIAIRTARHMTLNLNPQNSSRRPTDNLEAYYLYLQGEYYFRRRETSKGGSFFKKAVELDPDFAKAWAGLAAAYAMGDAMEQAGVTVDRALRLDPDLAEAHAVRGFIKMFLEWDWPEAERSLKRSVELNQNSVEAHHWLGIYLQIRGRFEEAEKELIWALELDPTSANLLSDLGQTRFFAGDTERAEETYLKTRTINEIFVKYRLLEMYEKQQRYSEMMEILPTELCPNDSEGGCQQAYRSAFDRNGIKGIAFLDLKRIMERLANSRRSVSQNSPEWYRAAINYQRLGLSERAIQSLQRSLKTKKQFETMNFTLPFIATDPRFENLRNEAGFQNILREMNLF